jgi:hypothetical protein
MACIAKLLENLRPEVESGLKPYLGGFIGAVIRTYLPQTWVFVTETEAATFYVACSGDTVVYPQAADRPDVTIVVDHAVIFSALSTRDSSLVPAGRREVRFQTQKGRTAFNFLRSRFGL